MHKSKFVTKFLTIIVAIFSFKNVSQIPCKVFATQCFFTDHLKHKTIKKQLAECTQQSLASYVPIS